MTGTANRRGRYKGKTIVVGGKKFPEGYILFELLAETVEHYSPDLEVVRVYRGSTNATYAQLRLSHAFHRARSEWSERSIPGPDQGVAGFG